MVTNLYVTAARLWRTVPAWKITVLAAGLFTVVSVLHALSGGSEPPPSAPGTAPSASVPSLPSDPASDARLAVYEAARDAADKVAGPGQRCEQVMEAYRVLTPEDRTRGRDVRASSKSRLAALAEGERCRVSLAARDAHFDVFERVVAGAETSHAADAMKAAAGAGAVFDGFDRSRSRYAGEAALLAKAKEFEAAITASDARIAVLLQAAQMFAGDRSAATYLRVATAVRQLTDFDRGRLTPAQRASLDIANQAATTLSESRGRLAKLFPLVAAIEKGQTAAISRQLIDATAAITPFDEAVATPEQKAALEKARAAAKPLVWSMMRDRLDAVARGETPETDQAVADIYRMVKDTPEAELNDQQRADLVRGHAAAGALAASDDRLGALLTAADLWRRRSGTESPGILSAMDAITPYDRARFQDQHKAAWATTSSAAAIILGPQRGLTAATKAHVPIFVFSSGQNRLDRNVADALRGSLHRAGFRIADGRNDAALLVDVSILAVDEPAMDTSGQFVAWSVTAHLSLSAVWSIDDSAVLVGPVQDVGRDSDRDEAKTAALRAAVAAIVRQFDQLAAK